MQREDNAHTHFTRRDFTKAAGATGILTAMGSPTVTGDSNATSLEAVSLEDAIEEPMTPPEWLTVGPFQFQRRDLMVDWLTPVGGEQAISDGDEFPDGEEFLPSELAAGGTASWDHVELEEGEETIPFDYSEAIDPSGEGDFIGLTGDGLTDNHQSWFGYGGVFLNRGYALATFEREETEVAVLETDASQVWVNGTLYDATPAGVLLQEGTNYVLAKQTLVLGGGSIDVTFRPPEAAVEITGIDRVPDLREGESADRPAAVRITNTTPDRVEDATVTLEPESGDLIDSQEVSVDPPLAPFETRYVNTRITTTDAVDTSDEAVETVHTDSETVSVAGMTTTATGSVLADGDSGTDDQVQIRDSSTHSETGIVVTVTTEGSEHQDSSGLTVRGPEDHLVTTYRSEVDESVQYFGYRRPANYDDSDGPYEAILFLHGAGVDADSAASSLEPREDTYVIAPETRGPVAYDHEDLGRLDDLEALEVAKERFDIDANQVYLLGHSMGGHGTWHIGMTHSDKWAGIGPMHSWPDHESYVIVPYQRDRLHTHPRLRSARDISLYKNLAGPNSENAADGNLPIFAMHGGADEETTPLMVRNHLRMFANRGLSITAVADEEYEGPGPDETEIAYLEVPGAGHWWDFDIGPGSDVVNHPDLYEWVRESSRDPYPEVVQFYTTNLAIEHQKYWIGVRRQRRAQTPTRVHAEITNGEISVQTENVAQLLIDYDVIDEHDLEDTVDVDGDAYEISSSDILDTDESFDGNPVAIDLEQQSILTASGSSDFVKTPQQYGPMRQVHYDPYRIVYGTGGDQEENEAALAIANLRSHRLADRARVPAPLLQDTDVTEEHIETYNLILVGTPDSNEILAEYADELPISVENGTVDVGSERYTGDLGVQYVYPNPQAPDQLLQVTTGTSPEGLRLNELVNWIPTQTPSPDYMVIDDEFRYQGWNGCLAAGYFDAGWDVSRELGEKRYLRGSHITEELRPYVDDGEVTADGLQRAIQDWRTDEIGTDVLQTVIEAWRSGTVFTQ